MSSDPSNFPLIETLNHLKAELEVTHFSIKVNQAVDFTILTDIIHSKLHNNLGGA